MAKPAGNTGIRADGSIRPVAVLKKDYYKPWSLKLKHALKLIKRWELVLGTEAMPLAAAAGATAAEYIATLVLCANWDQRYEISPAVLNMSISDDELVTVHAHDENPIQIWALLREKFERRSEAEAESAQMELLDFSHREGELANVLIERFETAVKFCNDQGVVVGEDLQKRMLLARLAERYGYLRQSYLLAPAATRPNLLQLKAHLRDIDIEFQKSNSTRAKAGAAAQAEAKASWPRRRVEARETKTKAG